MFYTGLFLNKTLAKESTNLWNALDQVDSIIEHQFDDLDDKLKELCNFFNGLPVLKNFIKGDLHQETKLDKKVQQLQDQLEESKMSK